MMRTNLFKKILILMLSVVMIGFIVPKTGTQINADGEVAQVLDADMNVVGVFPGDYSTFNAALHAADGGTLKLLDDYETTSNINVYGGTSGSPTAIDVTIDLNGHTLTYDNVSSNGKGMVIDCGSNLTITDSGTDGTYRSNCVNSAITVNSSCTVTVKKGIIESTSFGNTILVCGTGVLNINGGTILSGVMNTDCILMQPGANGTGTINMTAGKILSDYPISGTGGVVNISGGTIGASDDPCGIALYCYYRALPSKASKN